MAPIRRIISTKETPLEPMRQKSKSGFQSGLEENRKKQKETMKNNLKTAFF